MLRFITGSAGRSGLPGRRYLCCLVVISWLFAIMPAAADIELTKNGQAMAVIVHNGHDQPSPELPLSDARRGRIVRSAAEELQYYLQQRTGAELPIVGDRQAAGDKPAIVMELVERVPGSSDRPTGQQAYLIKTQGKNLLLKASTLLGLHNAVYGLLEDHLGCRFYTHRQKGFGYAGKGGYEFIPQKPDLTITDIDSFQEPAFANRGFVWRIGTYMWVLRNRGIGIPAQHCSGDLRASHNLYDLIPPTDKKIGGQVVKGLFKEHPELYSMGKDGKRSHPWNMGICGTNPILIGPLVA